MPDQLGRRSFLRLCAAAAVVGCAPKSVEIPSTIPSGPIRLGWRWVPGEEYNYRTVVEKTTTNALVSRAEQWSYLVRSLDRNNIATLEAHLVGFGAGLTVDNQVVSEPQLAQAIEAEKSRSNQPVQLQIDMNGRLVNLNQSDFARGIPHRMLCLNLPKTPINQNQRWANDEVLQPFVKLLPAQLRTQSSAHSQILALRTTKGRITAVIETSGTVRSEGGDTLIGVMGEAIWNAEHGHLLERTLRITVPDESRMRLANPGSLNIRTQLV